MSPHRWRPAVERELYEALLALLFEPPRNAVEQTLIRARARGDPRDDYDHELALDFVASFMYYRALIGQVPSDTEIERAIETLLQGIAADYPALIARTCDEQGDVQIHHLHA